MADARKNRCDLSAAIAAAAQVGGFADAEVTGLRRLSGGASKESWAFDLTTASGEIPLVLRRAPPEARFASAGTIDLGSEAALLRLARAARVPVPEVLFELPADSDAGQGFAMRRIEGESVGTRILRSEALAGARADLARQCGSALAAIHAIPVDRAPPLARETPREALALLDERYRATGQSRPVFDWAIRWLDQKMRDDVPTTLLHGDFRNGNLIVGEDGLRAVLDWETAHIGCAAEDLGWLCVPSWRFSRPDLPVGGFGHLDDLLAGYRAGGGAEIDPADIRLWQAFGSFRWGVMCAEVGARFAGGVRTVEGAMIARRASEVEWDLVQLIAGEYPDA